MRWFCVISKTIIVGGSYPSALMQSVYCIATTNCAIFKWIKTSLHSESLFSRTGRITNFKEPIVLYYSSTVIERIDWFLPFSNLLTQTAMQTIYKVETDQNQIKRKLWWLSLYFLHTHNEENINFCLNCLLGIQHTYSNKQFCLGFEK